VNCRQLARNRFVVGGTTSTCGAQLPAETGKYDNNFRVSSWSWPKLPSLLVANPIPTFSAVDLAGAWCRVRCHRRASQQPARCKNSQQQQPELPLYSLLSLPGLHQGASHLPGQRRVAACVPTRPRQRRRWKCWKARWTRRTAHWPRSECQHTDAKIICMFPAFPFLPATNIRLVCHRTAFLRASTTWRARWPLHTLLCAGVTFSSSSTGLTSLASRRSLRVRPSPKAWMRMWWVLRIYLTGWESYELTSVNGCRKRWAGLCCPCPAGLLAMHVFPVVRLAHSMQPTYALACWMVLSSFHPKASRSKPLSGRVDRQHDCSGFTCGSRLCRHCHQICSL